MKNHPIKGKKFPVTICWANRINPRSGERKMAPLERADPVASGAQTLGRNAAGQISNGAVPTGR
jgi:hypothetical protein